MITVANDGTVLRDGRGIECPHTPPLVIPHQVPSAIAGGQPQLQIEVKRMPCVDDCVAFQLSPDKDTGRPFVVCAVGKHRIGEFVGQESDNEIKPGSNLKLV